MDLRPPDGVGVAHGDRRKRKRVVGDIHLRGNVTGQIGFHDGVAVEGGHHHGAHEQQRPERLDQLVGRAVDVGDRLEWGHIGEVGERPYQAVRLLIVLKIKSQILPSKDSLSMVWKKPIKHKHLYNICTMLGRWPNIVQMLYKCFVLAASGFQYKPRVLFAKVNHIQHSSSFNEMIQCITFFFILTGY